MRSLTLKTTSMGYYGNNYDPFEKEKPNLPKTKHGESDFGLFTSYTLPGYDKRSRFKMDGIYYKNSLREKMDSVYELNDGNFTIIDTETNGKNLLGESLPFQFSGIRYRNWKEESRLVTFINVGKIPDEILELTHCEQSWIDGGMAPDDAMDTIMQFLGDEKIIFAHNAGFDIAILNNLLVHTGRIDEPGYVGNDHVYVRDSMQYFYAIYKHTYGMAVTGSSMEFLTNYFFMIDRDASRAHQADYDCELLFELILKFVESVNKNYEYVQSEIVRDDKIQKYKKYVVDNAFNKEVNVKGDMQTLGNTIVEEYAEYLEIKDEIEDLKSAVTEFLTKTRGEKYASAVITPFFVKKNVPFETVKYEYLATYVKKNDIRFFVDDETELEFFIERSIEDVPKSTRKVKDEKEMVKYLYEITELVAEMASRQATLNSRLSIIRAYVEETNEKKVGNLIVKIGGTKKYLDRTPNAVTVLSDIKSGKIKSLSDVMELRGYDTNLTVQLVGEGVDYEAVKQVS